MHIGFIGLGGMGSAMAARLVAANHRVRVWNRSAKSLAGAETARALTDLRDAEIVISMLADDAAVRDVFLTQGLLGMMKAGAIHVNMATVSVELARDLAPLHEQRGVHYVAAPVLGRPDAAAAGKLHIVAAGPPDVLATVQPVFDILGQRTWTFGEKPEQANVVKLATNFTLACAIEAMSEAAQFVRSHDVAARDFLGMLAETLFASPVYKTYGALIAEEKFSPAGFRLALGAKDVRLALAAGETAHVPLPFASVLRDAFLDAIAHGDADLDWAALAKVSQRRAGR